MLIVHLKRFEFSSTRKGKIKETVDFPLKNLDLTPYVSRLQRDKPIYDLFAVMVILLLTFVRTTRAFSAEVITIRTQSTEQTSSGTILMMRLLTR